MILNDHFPTPIHTPRPSLFLVPSPSLSPTTIPGQANLPLDLTSGATAAGVRTQ